MNADLLFERIEKTRGIELSPEEKYEIDQWGRGRALAQIRPTEGWQEILAMLGSYAGRMTEDCINTDPSNTKEVLANHAMAHCASRIFKLFQEDADAAIEASRTTPDCVKEGLKRGPTPVESAA